MSRNTSDRKLKTSAEALFVGVVTLNVIDLVVDLEATAWRVLNLVLLAALAVVLVALIGQIWRRDDSGREQPPEGIGG